jgi:molybdopterin-guanine dinucleotide biosynthesis protein A
LNGEPMLAHVIKHLRPQVQQVLLSCEPGDEALAGFNCTMIDDAVPRHRGPLAGLYSALLFLNQHQLDGGLMLCPCDAPFIPTTLVEKLQVAASKAPDSVAVVSYDGVLQPTFSLWQSQHLPSIEAAVLARGQGGLKHMLYDLPHTVVEWPLAEPPPFYNINTPDQLKAASDWLEQVNLRASES